MSIELRERDALWCRALIAILDTDQIAKVTAEFNRIRPDKTVNQNVSTGSVWFWICKNCEQKNGKEYDVCWRCKHARPAPIATTPSGHCYELGVTHNCGVKDCPANISNPA